MSEVLINIKELRLRLGWNRQQMADYIKCDVRFVEKWEANGKCPPQVHANYLVRLLATVEENSERIQFEPISEQTLEENGLSQMQMSKAS